GMSETSGGCVYDGRPLDGVDVRVADDGRVLLRGPMVMTGYRGRPDLTADALRDGWFHTDDVGRWDGTHLVVDGRRDDVIVTGGENVAAARVAALLAEHPAVAEVAVTGVPDAQWGQRVVAVVVARGAPPTLAELRQWVSSRASAAHAPHQLVVVPDIPRLTTGKPDRLAVRALAGGDSA